MNPKAKKLFFGAVLVCIFLSVYFIIQNSSEEYYDLKEISAEYAEIDNTVVATIGNEEITNRDLCIIKYLYYKEDCIDIAVRQKSVAVLAEIDGFALSPQEEYQEKKYVNNKLNLTENVTNIAFKEDLIENTLELSISNKYETYIENKILDNEFSCENKFINFEYNMFKHLQKKWMMKKILVL